MKVIVRSLMSVILSSMVVLAAQSMAHQEEEGGTDDQSSPMTIKLVEAKYVCMGMGADRVFDRELMPAVVDDKTYYGCCGGCQTKLLEDPQVRVATDPMTGVEVDKATAVIGALPSGIVHYFESLENLQRFEKMVNSIKVTKPED